MTMLIYGQEARLRPGACFVGELPKAQDDSEWLMATVKDCVYVVNKELAPITLFCGDPGESEQSVKRRCLASIQPEEDDHGDNLL